MFYKRTCLFLFLISSTLYSYSAIYGQREYKPILDNMVVHKALANEGDHLKLSLGVLFSEEEYNSLFLKRKNLDYSIDVLFECQIKYDDTEVEYFKKEGQFDEVSSRQFFKYGYKQYVLVYYSVFNFRFENVLNELNSVKNDEKKQVLSDSEKKEQMFIINCEMENLGGYYLLDSKYKFIDNNK